MTARAAAPRIRLSRAKIVEAASALLEEGGDLTFRQLGAALGADPTAIYRHFRTKEELILAVVDRIAEEVLDGWEATGDWRADLRSIGQRTYTAYARRPRLAKVTALRTAAGQHETELVEQILVALHRAGLTGTVLARTYRTFAVYVLSFLIGQSVHVSLGVEVLAADREKWLTHYRTAPAEAYPMLAEVGELILPPGEGPEFTDGLELLLDGIARLAAPTSGA